MKKALEPMLVSLHEHFPLRFTDWLLSAILLSWGLALFDLDPSMWASPVYSGLSSMWPQMTWAIISTGLGIARLVALFINGALRRSPHLRGVGAFLSIFIWVQISLGLVASGLSLPGLAICPWLALADVFNVFRAAQDAHVSDERAKRRRSAVVARGVSAGS